VSSPPNGTDGAPPRSPAPGGRDARVAPSPVPPPPSGPHVPRSPRLALEPEKVPLPKRRSRRVRHPLVIVGNAIFTVLVVVSIAVGAALYLGKERFDAPGPLPEDKVVNIPRGLGIKDIASLLERDGVIDQPYVFIGGVMVLKARGGLKHGEYKFAKHASLADVVTTIIDGKVVQHALTIAEGLTSEQIVARLLENDALTGQIKEIPREGSLLPETYKFTRGMTRAQIIERMQHAEKTELNEIWARRAPDLPLKSPEELVTLASIVEKETGRPDERTRVAAVFVNRLKNKMKLQSDPTIIYGLTGGKGSLGRPLMKSEIEQPTPYNTYVITGLPPGPIANPGKASLEAVANPARTKDLYFVADGTGHHLFSETYEQHQKNVAKLRAFEHANAPSAAKPAAPKSNGAKP
jgi:peptidoglycan lytic transglycosylase G